MGNEAGNVAVSAETVREIFARAFALEDVAPDDDFFDLGGDSLLAESIALELSEIAGREVQVSLLFDFPTPRSLFGCLFGSKPVHAAAHGRPPIFLVHGVSGYTVPRPSFFTGLASDQRLELFQIPGRTGHEPVPESVAELARIYADRIGTAWPSGPVHLGSFCTGALIALEIANEMERRGRPLAHLVLLDPGAPRNLRDINDGRRARLTDRLLYYPVTGRLTGGASLEDLADRRLFNARRRLYRLEKSARALRDRILRGKDTKGEAVTVLDARATLHAALRHVWPEPYKGSADVLCSRQKAEDHAAPESFWRRMLPKAHFQTVVERHKEITGAVSAVPAEVMQRCFDRTRESLRTAAE